MGDTLTHALLSFSAAKDASNVVNCPFTDQSGAISPIDGDNDGIKICDMGAYEFGIGIRPITLKPAIQGDK